MLRCLVPVVVFLALGLLRSLPASAGIVVTTAPNAPTTNLLASHSASITNFAESWRWIGNVSNDHRDLGQSFLLSAIVDSVLDKITVRVREFGASVPNSSYTMEIWTFSDRFDGSGNVLLNSQADVLPSSSALGLGRPILDIRFRECYLDPRAAIWIHPRLQQWAGQPTFCEPC
jgi:hypothetical protein